MITGHKIEGAGEFLNIKIQAQALDNRIRQAVQTIAKKYRDEARALIIRGKTGTPGKTRMAFGKSSGLYKRASAPGEAPGENTGRLLRSIRTKYRQDGYGARVYAHRGSAWYRHLLEFGTAQRPRIRRKGFKFRDTKGRLRRAYYPADMSGGGTGQVLPRPLWSPLQSRMTDETQQAVEQAVARFAAQGGI